ncbi:MAG: MetS family NSS transporter small subunit [Candidatus Cloacimonadia bacterium]
MPLSAIIMLIIGCIVLYGGLAYCLHRATKSKKRQSS